MGNTCTISDYDKMKKIKFETIYKARGKQFLAWRRKILEGYLTSTYNGISISQQRLPTLMSEKNSIFSIPHYGKCKFGFSGSGLRKNSISSEILKFKLSDLISLRLYAIKNDIEAIEDVMEFIREFFNVQEPRAVMLDLCPFGYRIPAQQKEYEGYLKKICH
ncbi:unnamed protein product [Lepeophtheirus salmonis]|uniref:(salmon louse) hypothetical protein n=1 Tax=Lepeophtheirus salmonis TaxID=72036 RepID=A0A7R8CUV6_LEPSM|nr:unnamed protein product [Lepeophtheirus salmonis]CAF2888381.1 unnamed protein product [Lepeophtheirus salmonis]